MRKDRGSYNSLRIPSEVIQVTWQKKLMPAVLPMRPSRGKSAKSVVGNIVSISAAAFERIGIMDAKSTDKENKRMAYPKKESIAESQATVLQKRNILPGNSLFSTIRSEDQHGRDRVKFPSRTVLIRRRS